MDETLQSPGFASKSHRKGDTEMGVQKEREGDPQGLLMKQGGGGGSLYIILFLCLKFPIIKT